MAIPSVEQLDQLSREDLLSLVKDLIRIVNQQQKRIAELEAEIAQLRQPPTTSSNSSQPPSRDQKANRPKKKRRKKHGPPKGHPKYSRPLVEQPDQIIVASVEECEHCHSNLKGAEPDEIVQRQITEIPPAKVFQLCLAHQLRDLQGVIVAAPRARWARQMQKLFRDAIHLRHRFLDGEMTLEGFSRRVTEMENHLDRLLAKSLTNEAAGKLQARYITHRDKLLTFLHYPEVPPTNNESERALRPSVIHRKVTNGFRSEWGANAYAAIQTVIATAKLKGEEVFQAIVNLMGTPILPFLKGSSP